LKKIQGDDGWDFHASEHRYQNDQPIPELPEPGSRLGRSDCSFLGIHFLSWKNLIWQNKFLPKKVLELEAIFHRGGWTGGLFCK
jgi:hypothetical protein